MSVSHSHRRKLIRHMKLHCNQGGGWHKHFRALVAQMVRDRQGPPLFTLQDVADAGLLMNPKP